MRLTALITAEQIAAAKPTEDSKERQQELAAAYGALLASVASTISPERPAKVYAALLIAFTMIDDALVQVPEPNSRRKTDSVQQKCMCCRERCQHGSGECNRRAIAKQDDVLSLCGDCAVANLQDTL